MQEYGEYSADERSPEEIEFEREKARRADILDSLGVSLSVKKAKAIEARVSQGIDERFYRSVEAYEGRDEVTRNYPGLRDTVQGYLPASARKTQTRSKIVPNVVRAKVNTASAQLQDIAFPTDDRNWDLRPSTNPELVEKMTRKDLGLFQGGQPLMLDDNGQQRQATVADVAKTDMEEAKKRAKAMRDEIDDQLDISAGGCGYEGVGREVMFDQELLGAGVIKGPIVTSRVKKVWMPISDGQKTVHVLQRIADQKPTSMRVNPWDIYPHPECGEHPKKFPIWERIPGVTAADIRNYAQVDGYLKDQIRKVLSEGPKTAESPADKPGTVPVTEETVYEAWEYHGELSKEELEAAGCKCGSDDDVFSSYSAVVVMINDTVIKAEIEVLDTEEMPYDFFVTNKVSGSWCGVGTAWLALSMQKVITAGWRTMLDNMGLFSGPQVVMKLGGLQPADGVNEIRGTKLWYDTSDGDDVQKAFQVYEISAHQTEFANVIKMGMDFLDSETAIPQLMQGEQGGATDVLGGMNILLTQATIMQRRKLKCYDDQVTVPHIGRYVDWNMQYNEKAEIKGDFEVQARASAALMDTEVQNRMVGGLIQVANNPAYAHGIKKWDLLRRLIRAGRFDPNEFVLDDEEIKVIEERMQQQQQQQDPRIQAALIKSEADKQIEAARIQFEERDNERQRQADIAIKMIDKELQSAELSSVEKQVLQKLKVTLALSAMDKKMEADLAVAGHAKDLYKHRNPQVINPPVEPQGRAQPGKAFQQ